MWQVSYAAYECYLQMDQCHVHMRYLSVNDIITFLSGVSPGDLIGGSLCFRKHLSKKIFEIRRGGTMLWFAAPVVILAN